MAQQKEKDLKKAQEVPVEEGEETEEAFSEEEEKLFAEFQEEEEFKVEEEDSAEESEEEAEEEEEESEESKEEEEVKETESYSIQALDDPEEHFFLNYDNDINEEFLDFCDGSFGYKETEWDSISQKDMDRFNEIKSMDEETLTSLKLGRISHLCRWAAAQRHLSFNNYEGFHQTALPLTAPKKRVEVLDYASILVFVIQKCASRGKFNEAFKLLKKLPELKPEDSTLHDRTLGVLQIWSGQEDEGVETIRALVDSHVKDAKFFLQLGEDLCIAKQWDMAIEFLDWARDLVVAEGNSALLGAVENATLYCERHLGLHPELEAAHLEAANKAV